jgi:thiamine phosphate synthase YjbQ (UPF0047 family)
MHSFNFSVLIVVIVLVCGLELAEGLRVQSLVRRRCSRLDASYYKELEYDTLYGIHFTDLTEDLREVVRESGINEGVMTVLSRHTTCGITINEMEGRLVDDTRQFLLKLCPPAYPYLHNDLHLRSGPPDWPGGDEAWRAQEPINAHSHLLVMLLGSSESVPIHKGELKIGTWQSVILAEFDGARKRTVAVQVTGD